MQNSADTSLIEAPITTPPADASKPLGRPPNPKLTVESIAEQIRHWSGNLAAVALFFGVHRHTISNKIKQHKSLQEVLSEARETMKDHVESKLYDNALKGDTTAVIFFLKTQAKDRGYVERHELTGADGIPLFDEIGDIINKIYGGGNPTGDQ